MDFNDVYVTYVPCEVYDEFMKALNREPRETPKLDALLNSQPPWVES